MNEQRRTWIFQANPLRYSIMESLQRETTEYWNLNQHSKDVRVGDRVLIWISGQDAGIYAIGTVLTSPSIIPDTAVGQAYWIDKAEGKKAKARVKVRYDEILTERPLRRSFLWSDPALWRLRILNFPRGTNFPVSEAEWNALQDWLKD